MRIVTELIEIILKLELSEVRLWYIFKLVWSRGRWGVMVSTKLQLKKIEKCFFP